MSGAACQPPRNRLAAADYAQRVHVRVRLFAALRERGVGFIESTAGVHSEARGALTQGYLGGVMFELVHDERR